MNLTTKHDIINDAVVRLNELADAKGAEKCVLIITLIQNLNELGRMIKEEDEKNDAAIKALTEKIEKLEKREDDENAIVEVE